ncbi:sigma-E factor negative regulatory protein [Povalibacter sp.]|uniref:sigma-E factor negative regulatory protein n=1 Tax=Povalibacter sp. TaxID=1962978 RepID=UPI002F3F19E9
MTDPVKEQLSACLDGELPETELDLLLRQVQRDVQVLQSLDRYSLISEALRGPAPVAVSRGFADRIAAAIEAEPFARTAVQRPSQAAFMRWMRPAAGIAIAAGVAAVAVIALQPVATDSPQLALVADNSAVSESAPSYTVPTNVATRDNGFIPAARLTNYVVAHSEYSSPLGRRTVLSGVLSDDQDQDQDQDVAVNVSSTGGSAEPQR